MSLLGDYMPSPLLLHFSPLMTLNKYMYLETKERCFSKGHLKKIVPYVTMSFQPSVSHPGNSISLSHHLLCPTGKQSSHAHLSTWLTAKLSLPALPSCSSWLAVWWVRTNSSQGERQTKNFHSKKKTCPRTYSPSTQVPFPISLPH